MKMHHVSTPSRDYYWIAYKGRKFEFYSKQAAQDFIKQKRNEKRLKNSAGFGSFFLNR
jgi:hypothetical protein